MTTFEWISIDDGRKPELAEGEEFSDDILLLVCDREGYSYELGCYYHSGHFIRRDDPVSCVIRYWAPLLVPRFPSKRNLTKDRAAVKKAFEEDAEECRRAKVK